MIFLSHQLFLIYQILESALAPSLATNIKLWYPCQIVTNKNNVPQARRSEPRGTISLIQTTIMAVQYKDGVIVGADSRTTTGSYIGMTTMLRFFFYT